MATRIADIIVLGKLIKRSISKRFSNAIVPAPDLDQYTKTMNALLDQMAAGIIAESYWLKLSANQAPWVKTDIHLRVGDEVSYFIEGRVYANQFLDIWINASKNVWAKVGNKGEIFRGTRSGHSFKANTDGELRFGNYFPNDWKTNQGDRKRDDKDYADVSGEFKILVIKWSVSAIEGLRSFAALGDYNGLVQSEIRRLQQGDSTPAGWHYLWNLGPAEIYHEDKTIEGNACIHCDTFEDVGILQYELDEPLKPSTQISWRWQVDELPSNWREDSLPSHDYLSLAVEFDNGRDLSYQWSRSLPVNYGYDCPLPSWQGKEYHIVIRTGEAELGTWLNEQRNIYDDYRQYIGEPPAKIVRVWLIANSLFQRQRGRCTYSDIVLRNGAENIQIL